LIISEDVLIFRKETILVERTYRENSIMTKKSVSVLAAVIVAISLIFGVSVVFAKDMTARDFYTEAYKHIKGISIEEAKALMGEAVFLDVRTEDEFKKGHIPGTKFLQRGWLELAVSRIIPDKEAHIVVYCASGFRSGLATYTLNQMGYKNAENMIGGWNDWLKAGYPVE
jgi:rhodanese-related sulfurtransferase